MAENSGSGVGTGLIAGILLVVLIAVGLIFINGGIPQSGKDVNVTVEAPKAPDLPKPSTGGDK
jgi:hypothetical protein